MASKTVKLSPELRTWLDQWMRDIYLYDLERQAFSQLDYDKFIEFQQLCEMYDMDTVGDALGESADEEEQ